MNEESLKLLQKEFPDFGKKVLEYEYCILKTGQIRPLDFILNFKNKVARRKSRRRLILKNVVSRVLIEIRDKRRRPSIANLLEIQGIIFKLIKAQM